MGGVGEEALADLVVSLLHENNGHMHASVCCEHLYDLDPAYKPLLKRVGGIKELCSRHSERLQYVEKTHSLRGCLPQPQPQRLSADTTPALNTVDVTLISHTHGRERRAERSIGRVDLQAAVKHGNREAASPGQRGEQRWRYEYNGVVYITDASSKHEITSWRVDGKDMLKDARDARLYGTHIVLVVDNSGSMRKGDVPGYRSRTDAVYASLLRDLVLPQLKQGSAEAESQIVVSLIEMSDDAHVLLEKVPLDEELARCLAQRRESYAHSHGNYLPSLSKAVQLLSASRESSRLMLVFLSDGAPSDHLFKECTHGVQVWQPLGNLEKPKQQRGKQVLRTCSALSEKGEKCRSAVQKSVNDECLKSIAQLGRTFGTDRVIVGCVGIGKEENFRLLERMAKTLPRGTFYKSHLNAECLGTVFSSLSSSLTSLRTESLDAAGGKLLTIRSAKVVDKMPSHIRSIRQLAGDEWFVCDSQVSKWIWDQKCGKLIQVSRSLVGSDGIAFYRHPFASGCERLVHLGCEIVVEEKGRAVERAGRWLITKLSKYEEHLFDLDFTKTFCRLHAEAQAQALSFNQQVDRVSSATQCDVNFVDCFVYRVPNPFSEGVGSVQWLHVLVEPELEGKYIKWNNNAGAVRPVPESHGQRERATRAARWPKKAVIVQDERGVFSITEEDEEQARSRSQSRSRSHSRSRRTSRSHSRTRGSGEDAPDAELWLDVPQAFSHYSFVASQYKFLICDVQGTWNHADGYRLTDPVLHTYEGKQHANGGTDKGTKGICRFFETHRCGPLCKKLGLEGKGVDIATQAAARRYCEEAVRQNQMKLAQQQQQHQQQQLAARAAQVAQQKEKEKAQAKMKEVQAKMLAHEQEAQRLKHVKEAEAKRQEEGARRQTLEMLLQQKQQLPRQDVMVAGVVGRRAEILNGVYEAMGELYNGKPLFRKQNDHDKWLLFLTTNRWCISSTASKDSKDCKGWCWSEEAGKDHPTQVGKWKIYANGAEDKVEEHAPMKCIVHQDVMVAGVVGRRAEISNGVYEAMGDLYNGKPLFRKQNDHDKWLLFLTTNTWCFTDTASKDSKDCKGWCWSVETGKDHPTQVGKWKIYANGAEDKVEEHAPMKCIVHQDVMVAGVVGRRAEISNGVYEAMGDLYNGKPLFRKQNDHDKWLLFLTTNTWCFTDTASKDSKDCKGWCWSVEAGKDHPTQVGKWEIYANGAQDKVEEHAPMKCIVCTPSLSRKQQLRERERERERERDRERDAAQAGQGGTVSVKWAKTTGPDGAPNTTNNSNGLYMAITAMPAYQNYSFDELRVQDYGAGRTKPKPGTVGGFGQSAAGGFGGFGQTQAAGGFGQPAAAPAFGAAGFGQPAANTFGGGGFGQSERERARARERETERAASELRRQPSRALQNAVYWQQRDEELRQEQESRGKCSIQ